MANIDVCDVCGAPADETRFFMLGRSTDAAGSMENHGDVRDLCFRHSAQIAWEILAECRRTLPWADKCEINARIVKLIDKMEG